MESPRQSEYDTVEYWKKQAKHYEQKANDMQQELDEYTENSAQLEKELEASLIQVEKQNRDLEHQNQRLKNEIESLKTKLDRSQHETNALENELQALKIEQDKKAEYIRELEQKNDDLERGQRVISESVSCIESLLNQAYERNAVLESEVDEVENLKQELKVVEKIPVHRKEDESTIENPMVNGHVTNSTKGQALESKLASCRGTVRPKEHSPNSSSDVNKDYSIGNTAISLN
ncbi:hypothetical protein MSG28_004135 [Choristoneura fumiferana]|uniref:Uncharacterized protein n=1 Tax=Choristoneura fumiferana TaxID=7141 RepID=A0ACC0KHH3_CHOFU|nr:hypothetical protein MSG28_004135 [Choristoneura fumiferana]